MLDHTSSNQSLCAFYSLAEDKAREAFDENEEFIFQDLLFNHVLKAAPEIAAEFLYRYGCHGLFIDYCHMHPEANQHIMKAEKGQSAFADAAQALLHNISSVFISWELCYAFRLRQ